MENNSIRFCGMKPSRSLLRYVVRQMEKWMDEEQALLGFLPSKSYQVQIERYIEEPRFHCSMNVQIGAREWRGFETGSTLQDAVTRAINRLKLVPSPTMSFQPELRKPSEFLVA